MSVPGQSPAMTCTPRHDLNETPFPVTFSSVQSVPLQKPPTIHLGHQVYNHPTPWSKIDEHQKRERCSMSSTSTDSSRRMAAPHPGPGPTHIHSTPFPPQSFRAEGGTMEFSRSTRACPNQYTRPSRREMAEMSATYHQTFEEDDCSETREDRAIWIVVCYTHRPPS